MRTSLSRLASIALAALFLSSTLNVARAIAPNQLVAFVRDHHVCLIRVDGTGLKQLTSVGECSSPHWTPDGKRIVFICNKQVWVMNSNGSAKRQLTRSRDWECEWPTVSSNGKQVLFGGYTKKGFEQMEEPGGFLRVMNLDGSGLRSLRGNYLAKPQDNSFVAPSFTPDGSTIIYCPILQEQGLGNIDLFSVHQGHKRILYGRGKQKSYYDCTSATFSPTGKRIAAACDGWFDAQSDHVDQSRAGIVAMNNDGTGVTLVFRGKIGNNLSWSSDGRNLAFATDDGSIEVFDLRTNTRTMVLRGGSANNSTPAFQPTGHGR